MKFGKEETIGVGIAGGIILVSALGIRFFKQRGKKKSEDLFVGDLEIVGKKHWMSNLSLDARKRVIDKVKADPKLKEMFAEELKVIDEKHWMSSEYKEAFSKISDGLWNLSKGEGK